MSTQNTLLTPLGIAHWPYLIKPDTAFNEAGVYKVELELEPTPEADALFTQIQEAMDSAGPADKPRAKCPMFRDDQGNYRIKLALRAHVVNRARGIDFQQKPKIVDGSNKAWDETLEIRAGSRLRCAFTIAPYQMSTVGVTLRLVAVQVDKLAEETVEFESPFDVIWTKDQTIGNNQGTRQQVTQDAGNFEHIDDDELFASFD